MARIPDTLFNNFIEGQTVHATDYTREREIMRVAINDFDDKVNSVIPANAQEAIAKVPVLETGLASTNEQLTGIANVLSFLPNTDITSSLNSKISTLSANGGGRIKIINGTYLINTSVGVNLKDNITLELSEKTILKAITNALDSYKVINMSNISNAKIIGGKIQGDRTTHTGTTGEAGHGVFMIGCISCYVETEVIDCWGDGVYINTCIDCDVKVKVDNARRNGISVIAAKNLNIIEPHVSNTNGTDPQYGIDIEPNVDGDILENIKIIGGVIENNAKVGIGIVFMSKAIGTVGIQIIGTRIKHSAGNINTKAITITEASGTLDGYIDIIDVKTQGMMMFELRANESDGIRTRIINPYIEDWNPSANPYEYGSAIMVYADTNDLSTLGNVGNVLIENPTLALINHTSNYGITVMDRRSTGRKIVKNVQIISPNFVGTVPVNKIYQAINDDFNDIYITGYEKEVINNAETVYQFRYFVDVGELQLLQFAGGQTLPSNMGTGRMEMLVEAYLTGSSTNTGAIALFTQANNVWSIIQIYDDRTNDTFRPQFVLDSNGKPAIKHSDTAYGKYFVVKHTLVKAYDNTKTQVSGSSTLLLHKIKPLLNALIGTTAQRPTASWAGQQYFDTTLGKPIWWSSTAWKDAAGTTV